MYALSFRLATNPLSDGIHLGPSGSVDGKSPLGDKRESRAPQNAVSLSRRHENLVSKISRLRSGQNEDDAKLLMIHQLWLWKLDDSTSSILQAQFFIQPQAY